MRNMTYFMAAGLLFLLASSRAATAESVRYKTIVTDEKGFQRQVAFDGTSERGVLAGDLNIGGFRASVKGVIAIDGSVSGSVFLLNGQLIGDFRGRPDGAGVAGTLTSGSLVVPWQAPTLRLPTATAP